MSTPAFGSKLPQAFFSSIGEHVVTALLAGLYICRETEGGEREKVTGKVLTICKPKLKQMSFSIFEYISNRTVNSPILVKFLCFPDDKREEVILR